MRYATIRDIDFDGHDLRVWCHRCGRGAVADGWIWQEFLQRGWAIELAAAAARFRCDECHRSDEVILFPARRISEPPVDWARTVARYFHNNRSRAKLARRRE